MGRTRAHKLIGNTAIIAIGQFGSKILVYFLTRLYTALLSKTEYSFATNISELATLLIPLISLGIGEAIFRLGKGDEFRRREIFTDAFAIWGAGSLLFAVIIPVLSLIPYFDGHLWLIVVYVLCSVLHTICTNYIRSQGKVKLYAIQGILNTLLVIGFNILFLIPLRMSSVGYVLSVPVADLLVSLFIILKEKLYREFDFRSVRLSSIRRILKYSVPLIPTTIFMWVINISDRFMVTYFCGDAVNGLYSAAYKIPTLLGVLNSIFIYAWQISAMDERNSKDKVRFYSRVFSSYASFMFLMGAAIILLCKVFTFLMFAPEYHDAWIYIPVLSLAMVLHNFSSFLDSDNMVRMNSLPTMYTALAGAVTNIVLNLLLIRVFSLGAMGAAIATYVSYVVTFVLRAVLVRRSIRINRPRMILNNVLVIGMIAMALTGWKWWFIPDTVLFLMIAALNFRQLAATLLRILPASIRNKLIGA